MYDCWVAYFSIQSRRNLYQFIGRAQKYWDHSTSTIHRSYAASCKQPRQQRTVARKNPSQKFSSAQSQRCRSREETERQERCARRDAWRMSESIRKLKEKDTARFDSPSDVRRLPAPSVIKLEEREFVVDSRASMHMLSRKDVNSAELETVRVSQSPMTVAAASGEVETHEEATVCIREVDLFGTVKLLEDRPAVLSLGKLCEDHGYSCECTSGQKPHNKINGSKYDVIRGTYRSLSLVYRRVLQSQLHLHL